MNEETRSGNDEAAPAAPAGGSPGIGPDAGPGAPAAGSAGSSRRGGFLTGALSSLGGALRPLWIPLIPGLCLVCITYVLWLVACDREFVAIKEGSEAQAGWLQSETLRAFQAREREVEGVAMRMAGPPSPGAGEWERAADDLLAGGGQVRAVAWMDTSFTPLSVAPAEERQLSALDPRDDELRRVALAAALQGPRPRGGVFVTGSVALATGGRQVLVGAPVTSRGRTSGYVVSVIRVRDLLDAVLKRAFTRGYSVTVYEGPYQIYGPVWAESGSEGQYANDVDVHAGDLMWGFRVWPGEDMARALESPAPRAVLVLGMIVAFLTSVVTYLMRTPRSGAATPRAGAGRGRGPVGGRNIGIVRAAGREVP